MRGKSRVRARSLLPTTSLDQIQACLAYREDDPCQCAITDIVDHSPALLLTNQAHLPAHLTVTQFTPTIK